MDDLEHLALDAVLDRQLATAQIEQLRKEVSELRARLAKLEDQHPRVVGPAVAGFPSREQAQALVDKYGSTEMPASQVW